MTELKILLSCAEKPHFRRTPLDQDTEQGSTVRLYCAAFGQPHPDISWSHDDIPIVSSDRIQVKLAKTSVEWDLSGTHLCMWVIFSVCRSPPTTPSSSQTCRGRMQGPTSAVLLTLWDALQQLLTSKLVVSWLSQSYMLPFYQVPTQLSSLDWEDLVPDLIHILNCGSARNQTCDLMVSSQTRWLLDQWGGHNSSFLFLNHMD